MTYPSSSSSNINNNNNPFNYTSQFNSINTTPNQYSMNLNNNNTLDLGDSSDKPPFRSREHEQWINERHSRERPSRTLFVRNIDFHSTDRDLEDHFRQFGPLKDFFSMSSRRGIAFVTFYDLRDSQRAKEGLNGSMVCGRNIDVHYSLPREDLTTDTKCDHSKNQGTLFLVFEDQAVAQHISDDDLRTFLESKFGDIVSMDLLRGNPAQRFVEFYDSRACVKAQRGLDRTDFRGSTIVAEYSWDKATKEALQSGQSSRDRFPRARGNTRSRSPGSRFRTSKDDQQRFSRHGRSPIRSTHHSRYNIDDRFNNSRTNPYSYTAPTSTQPSAATGMSAEQVQRMLLAAAGGGGSAQQMHASNPGPTYSGPNNLNSNALSSLAASFSAHNQGPGFGAVQPSVPISAGNAAALMMNQSVNNMNHNQPSSTLTSQLAALSALLPSLTGGGGGQQHQPVNPMQQNMPQQQQPYPTNNTLPPTISGSTNTTNPTWAALAQLMNAASQKMNSTTTTSQNVNVSSQNTSTNSSSSSSTPLAAQLSSLLGSVSSSHHSAAAAAETGHNHHHGGEYGSYIGNGSTNLASSSSTNNLSTAAHASANGGNTTVSASSAATGYNAYAALLQQMRSQQVSEGSSSSNHDSGSAADK